MHALRVLRAPSSDWIRAFMKASMYPKRKGAGVKRVPHASLKKAYPIKIERAQERYFLFYSDRLVHLLQILTNYTHFVFSILEILIEKTH